MDDTWTTANEPHCRPPIIQRIPYCLWTRFIDTHVCPSLNTLHITTIISYEHHGISNHRPLDCLFKSLFGLKTKKTPKFYIAGPLWDDSGLPSQKASNAESIALSWHYVTAGHLLMHSAFLMDTLHWTPILPIIQCTPYHLWTCFI